MRPALSLLANFNHQLCLVIRGDAFPVANASWTQISITVVNPTKPRLSRKMCHTWPIGIAWCDDKDFSLLARLFEPIFQVPFPAFSLYYCYCCCCLLSWFSVLSCAKPTTKS